jgi:DNA repair protein RecN (Recombination protein N)
MLRSLQIRNFAIIDEIDITFNDDMTVLTGETGAGKSILIDALSLVLGERGSSNLIRNKEKRAEYTAEFEITNNSHALNWLIEKSLDNENECILRRTISPDGKSRSFINGNTVNLQSLKSLGDLLVDIHGQHFHQSLCKKNVQRDLLDHFGGLSVTKNKIKRIFNEWKELSDQLSKMIEGNTNKEDRIDLLSFQLKELDELALISGEYDSLNSEFKKISNIEKINKGINSLIDCLQSNEITNVEQMLNDSIKNIDTLATFDNSLEETKNLLSEAEINVSEAIGNLSRYGESIDYDNQKSREIEERINTIISLSRKHRVDPDELIDTKIQIEKELNELNNSQTSIDEAERHLSDLRKKYDDLASELTKKRSDSAKKLSGLVADSMNELGMTGGIFEVEITPSNNISQHGNDDITFHISANPGQKPQPLSNIASGGELSRMSLAIQVITSNGTNIPTMIFDEVDSGIGGAIAEVVGNKLKDLGQNKQVLCVTHLAQVASKGSSHIRINKLTDNKKTKIYACKLNADERIEEIARMIGGIELTEKTREYAKEMLSLRS